MNVARWVESGWGYRAASVDDLMRAVSRIGTLQLGRRYVWRGVPNQRWKIQSSLVRHLIGESTSGTVPSESEVRQRERAIIAAARTWRLDNSGQASDQEVLAALQHHGVPTRFLDVTCNPMTALWFACQVAPGGRDAAGALFAFDVSGLPVLPTATALGLRTWGSLEDPRGWQLRNELAKSEKSSRPFLVEPTDPDPRMRAQEGLFLTGAVPPGPSKAPVDGLPIGLEIAPGAAALDALFGVRERTRGRPRSLALVALVIPPALKRTMRSHLETTYNRRQSVLFPDVAGFAKALREGAIDLPAVE